MTTTRTTPPPSTTRHVAGPVRRSVGRHPLGAFTALVLGAGWPVMSVPALTAHGIVPGGPLPTEPFVLATVLLVMLPAALGVTAVVDGRTGVRQLLARTVRWRIGAGWWAAVALGLPATTVLVGFLTGRAVVLDGLGDVLLGALVSTVTAIVLVNLWEEAVWAGFLQTRLQARHGFWPAAVLTAAAFAAIHVPLQFAGEVSVGSVAVAVGLLLVLGLLVRVMVGVVLLGTGGSVLAVAVLHATFNSATGEDQLADRLLSGTAPLVPALLAVVLLTAAAAVRARRGRAR